jgi:hypothetical protein
MPTYTREKWQDYRIYQTKPKPSPKLKTAMRICLLCQKAFESTWIGNRRCRGCLDLE